MWRGFQIASHLAEAQDVKTYVGGRKKTYVGARKKAEINKTGANQNAEKNVAKFVAKNKCTTSLFAKESGRMTLIKWKKMWKILNMQTTLIKDR